MAKRLSGAVNMGRLRPETGCHRSAAPKRLPEAAYRRKRRKRSAFRRAMQKKGRGIVVMPAALLNPLKQLLGEVSVLLQGVGLRRVTLLSPFEPVRAIANTCCKTAQVSRGVKVIGAVSQVDLSVQLLPRNINRC
jgi:hypothetical protein